MGWEEPRPACRRGPDRPPCGQQARRVVAAALLVGLAVAAACWAVEAGFREPCALDPARRGAHHPARRARSDHSAGAGCIAPGDAAGRAGGRFNRRSSGRDATALRTSRARAVTSGSSCGTDAGSARAATRRAARGDHGLQPGPFRRPGGRLRRARRRAASGCAAACAGYRRLLCGRQAELQQPRRCCKGARSRPFFGTT